MMHVADIPEIMNLPTPEKIQFLEELWESISSDEESIPVPDSHKTELTRRLESLEESPDSLITLDELKSRVAKRK